MAKRARTAKEMRFAAARRARSDADEAERCGNPEAAAMLRDLAGSISRIRLTVDEGA